MAIRNSEQSAVFGKERLSVKLSQAVNQPLSLGQVSSGEKGGDQ